MFRVTTFGESHGGGVGCVVDGVPARLNISQEEIQYELDRRRPGQSRITTPRKETDTCEILHRGFGICERVKDVESNVDHSTLSMEAIESNPVRCPDEKAADLMYKAIDDVRTRGESCGGEVTCVVKGCPKGLGSPVFDKLEAELAKAVMSLPATKGFEIGSGFSGSRMLGSEHNDEYFMEDGRVRTKTNRSGGVQGGISNGEDILLRIAFKPTATIARKQNTVNRDGEDMELLARGRHDPCVVPRAVPMVESMVALVLADQLLQHISQCELLSRNNAAGNDVQVLQQFVKP
eukprot:jgi/Picre1/30547/NNA_005910.t1